MNEIKEADKIIEQINKIDLEKIVDLRAQAEKTTSSFSDIRVQGHSTNKKEDIYLELAELTKQVDKALKMLDKYSNETNDKSLKIYVDRKIRHLSWNAMEYKYGIGRRQMQRIIKKIRKKS